MFIEQTLTAGTAVVGSGTFVEANSPAEDVKSNTHKRNLKWLAIMLCLEACRHDLETGGLEELFPTRLVHCKSTTEGLRQPKDSVQYNNS